MLFAAANGQGVCWSTDLVASEMERRSSGPNIACEKGEASITFLGSIAQTNPDTTNPWIGPVVNRRAVHRVRFAQETEFAYDFQLAEKA